MNKKLVFLSLTLILLASLFFRLSYVMTVEMENPIRADAQKYVNLAFNIVNNGVYSHYRNATEHNTFITPGYPLFLATITKISPNSSITYLLIILSQVMMSVATVGLIFLLALRLMPLPWATVVGSLAAIAPHSITLCGYLLTETLFTFLMILSIYLATLFWQRKTVLMAALFALACVAASFVRPSFLLFPMFIACVFFWNHRSSGDKFKLAAPLTMVLITVVLWAPWQVWQSKHQQPDGENLFASALALGSYPDLKYNNRPPQGVPYRLDPQSKELSSSVKNALPIIAERFSKDPLGYLRWYTLGKPLMYLR